MTNRILKYTFIIPLFLADISMIMPTSHHYAERHNYTFTSVPISHKLENTFSSNESFYAIDSIFTHFMGHWNIKGASMAIAKNGKLVFTKGYGFANKEANELVAPHHIFRIASVSKLITAVAIMKLIEKGNIHLHQSVFGKKGILNSPEYNDIYDERAKEITIHHLLNHSAGWSRRKPDPMFTHFTIASEMNVELPLTAETIIQFALSRPLDFHPGEKSSYSNLGYAILGKVIEAASGMTYEGFVKTEILHPLGIFDMNLAKTHYKDRYENEVKYYGPEHYGKVRAIDGSGKYVPRAYGGNNMETISAAGGWLASPTELMKLILAIDGFESKPEILTQESIDMMVKHGNNFFPYGWRGAREGFWWRTGTLTGSSALVARQSNGISWVVLFNTTTANAGRFPRHVHKTMNHVLSSVSSWPSYDLFDFVNSSNREMYLALK